MALKRHNGLYQAGPTFPDAIGDRYYAQDLFRDLNFGIDDAGQKAAAGFEDFPVLLKDSDIKEGTLSTDIDIPVARGIVKYEIDVPNSYAALPPTVTQEDVYVRIETTAEVDFDISGTATLDGATTNYVKVTYTETDGSTRTRAKKAGSYVYEKAVSYTITVDDVAPTDYDLVLATLVGDGAGSLIITPYPKTRHLGAAYDYVVSTQEEFNVLIDYTAANQYRIKDNIKSIYVKYLAGGYQMTGATSPLQEGDAYGYIETNDCSRIVFEPGTFIDFHQNIGYIEIDTNYCRLERVSIRGDKGAAAAITRSFLLNASYVILDGCESRTRLSNTTFTMFEGSGTAIHNETSKVNNCSIVDCDSSGDLIGFRYFYNMSNCLVYDIESTGAGAIVNAFYQCNNIQNSVISKVDSSGGGVTSVTGYNECDVCTGGYIKDLDAANVYGLFNCNDCSNITMSDFDGTTSVIGIYGPTSSIQILNIYIYDLNASAGTCYGIRDVNNVTNCYIKQLDGSAACYGVEGCNYISSCYVEDIDSSAGNSYGLNDCDYISSTKAIDIDASGTAYAFYDCLFIGQCEARTADYGFYLCNDISASYSLVNRTDGYYDCDRISGCSANQNTGNGYTNCNYISSSAGNTNGVDGYNNCDACRGCLASNNTGDGFQDCNAIGGNRSAGNGGANYNNCFADWGAAQAVADTNVGGYNG